MRECWHNLASEGFKSKHVSDWNLPKIFLMGLWQGIVPSAFHILNGMSHYEIVSMQHFPCICLPNKTMEQSIYKIQGESMIFQTKGRRYFRKRNLSTTDERKQTFSLFRNLRHLNYWRNTTVNFPLWRQTFSIVT